MYRSSIRHPWLVLALAAVAVAAAAPGVLRLELRTDGHALVPQDRDEVIFDRRIREEFNTEDVIVVLIRSRHADGIFNTGTLQLVKQLTLEFQALEEVRPYNVSSLETEHSHRVKQGTLDFRRFLQPLPETPEALETLRDDLEKIELHTGTIVSFDGTAAAILVGVRSEVDRTQLYGKLLDIIASHQPRRERIEVIGAPVAEALLGTHILEDLGLPRTLQGLRPDVGSDTPDESSVTGTTWPGSFHELRVWIGRHIGLVPIAILLMAIVFVLSFRSLTAAMLPMCEIGACLLMVFGLMGWIGTPVYLTVVVMPVILTAIGTADEIHVFSRYLQELRDRPGGAHIDALSTAMKEMWVPVVKTSATTAVGFLCFALSPLWPVRAFGIFTAVGIILCMLWSLTVIPAMLALINPHRFVRRPGQSAVKSLANANRPRGFGQLGPVVRRGRYALIAVAVVAVIAAPLGVARVTVQDSWIDGFAPESDFYKTTQFFNEQFLGTHLLLVCVETEHRSYPGTLTAKDIDHHEVRLPSDIVDNPELFIGHRIHLRRRMEADARPDVTRPPRRASKWYATIEKVDRQDEHLIVATERRRGSPLIALRPTPGEEIEFEVRVEPLTMPEVLTRIRDLEDFIRQRRELTVGGVIGTASLMSTANYMARGLKEGARTIPDTSDRVRWVWSQYKRIRGEERLRQLVDADYAKSLVTVFMKNANYVDVAVLMDAIRAYEREHLRAHGISLEFAGDVAVSQTLIDAIVETQVWSLIGSLVGILVITTLMGGSLRWGLLCVLPCALAVLINFAVMGWTGMPLGVATSMFAGMTLGIGVDFAIHLLERYRLSRSRGATPDAAVIDALYVTGPAVCIDAFAVALGFGILTLSQVPANARLGALLALSVLSCLVATLLLLPALLSIFRPGHRSAGAEDTE